MAEREKKETREKKRGTARDREEGQAQIWRRRRRRCATRNYKIRSPTHTNIKDSLYLIVTNKTIIFFFFLLSSLCVQK